MKRYIKSSSTSYDTLTITMYLRPIFYYDSKISASVYRDKNGRIY